MVSEGGEYGSKSSRQVRKIQSGREPDPHSQRTERGSERVRLGEVVEKVGGFILSLILPLKVGRKDECVGVERQERLERFLKLGHHLGHHLLDPCVPIQEQWIFYTEL